ncbi:hypothetical protein [Streptomyces chattanoogensis]|nr:hypothetical protein [Streptomyces chattanoogensis]
MVRLVGGNETPEMNGYDVYEQEVITPAEPETQPDRNDEVGNNA